MRGASAFGMWLLAACCLAGSPCVHAAGSGNGPDSARLVVRKTEDFAVGGAGRAAPWNRTEWVTLPVLKAAGRAWRTEVKVMYSDAGLYFLFRCEDGQLTATIREDFGALYTEDVVEVFLWPDPSVPLYFEYELSPLNHELPILVPNLHGRFMGWKPWQYQGARKTRHATHVQRAERGNGGTIRGWTAEFFIPFELLRPLVAAPPGPGTEWRANLYRIDYDQGMATWAWQKTDGNFHEYRKFGTLVFE